MRIEHILTILKMSMLDSFNEFLIETRLSDDGREDNEEVFKQCVHIMRGMQLQDELFEGSCLKVFDEKFVVISMPVFFKSYTRKMTQDKLILDIVWVEYLRVILDGNESVRITGDKEIYNW
jgi:secreted Zn-dependent insulinase-like peptidase